MNYKRRSWNGVLPVNFLAQWASEKKVSNDIAALAVFSLHLANITRPISMMP